MNAVLNDNIGMIFGYVEQQLGCWENENLQ
jgi:hypothetical protein